MSELHEYALAENIFYTCLKTAEHYGASKIIEINLEIGDFTLVVEDLLEQSFRIIAEGTVAADAVLKMVRVPGRLLCLDCGTVSEIRYLEEKKREEEEREDAFKKYEEEVAVLSGVEGYRLLGINLFKCRKCGSRNTELTGGKEVKIKNIKII